MVVMVPFPASEDLSRILNWSDSEKQWLACPLLEDDKGLNHSSCRPCFALEEGKSQAGTRGPETVDDTALPCMFPVNPLPTALRKRSDWTHSPEHLLVPAS